MTTPVDIVQRYTANNNLKKNILVNTYKNHYNEGEIKFCNLKRIGISLGDMCRIKGKILNLGLTYLKKDNGLTNPFVFYLNMKIGKEDNFILLKITLKT